jgi:hypothetical protein
MKRELTLILTLFLLSLPIITAPGTTYEEPDSNVESITLEADGNEISWETNGESTSGFKVTWSKNENPTYPTREGDKYHYHSDPNKNEDILTDFNGAGEYYVRVCEYLGGQCGTYSNQVKTWLGEGEEEEEEVIEEEEEKEEEEETVEEDEEEENHSTTPEEPTPCNGCLSSGICYPLGHRINGTFCANDLTLTEQFGEEVKCENNFECESNVCVSSECISAGFIRKIINWFKRFF